MKNIFLFFLIIFFAFTKISRAEEPVFDGKYYNWEVFDLTKEDGERLCYIASHPIKTIGNYKNERNPYLIITYFKSKEKQEVSVFADYKYKINSLIHLMVDNNKFEMVTNDQYAWTRSKSEDKQLIENLLKAKLIKIRSESNKNEYTVDYYTTKGLFVAYNRMMELCR